MPWCDWAGVEEQGAGEKRALLFKQHHGGSQ